MDAEKS